MVWGLVLSCIFIPSAANCKTVILFLICLLLGMVGNAFFHPQVSALIRDFNKNNPNLSKVMSVFLGLGTIGYAIGPYISTFFVENFGVEKIYFLGLFGFICALFMYFFVPKIPDKDCYIKENIFVVLKEILKNKKCMFLTLVSIIKSALSISFGTYIPFLLQEKGFSLSSTGMIVTLFYISGAIGTILSAKLEKKFGANGVVVFSFVSILPLLLLFLYLLNYNKNIAVVLFIIIGFFILLSVGIILTHAQNVIPKYTGVISGVIQGFSWGIGALFLAPLGIIGQKFGVGAILVLMSLIAFIIGIYTLKNNCLKN
jgi:FSR family fosmidomycin resistance protein-like MFS transporter